MSKRAGLLVVMALFLATSFSIAQEEQEIDEKKEKVSIEELDAKLDEILQDDIVEE